MKSRVLPAIAALVVLGACSTPDSSTSPAPTSPSYSHNPNDEIQNDPNVHIYRARGQARPGGGGTSLLTWHNGILLNNVAVQAIYWGTSWPSDQSDKIGGLDAFYGGLNNTSYAKTNSEYTGSSNTRFSGAVSYAGHVIDPSSAARNGSNTSPILAEVCKVITNPVANGFYPVYTDSPRGHAGYCAWHSYGTCNGVPVQFGFFFALDGDAGCNPGAPYYGHSQGLAALANVSGHEISETVTDPRNGGWWDANGAENADKCAWTFSGSAVSVGGQSWRIQGNFSNAAFAAKSGYDGAGCIDR
jgi:hypothetical protein